MQGRVRFARQSVGTARGSFFMHRALNEHHPSETLDRVTCTLSRLHPTELSMPRPSNIPALRDMDTACKRGPSR